MNEFATVFDLTSKSVRAHAMLPFIFSILAIIAGITGVIFYKWVTRKLQIPVHRSIYGILALLGLWWPFGHMDILNYAILNKAKDSQVVEGVVHVSHRQPYSGHTTGDKITIDGEPFVVDFFSAAPGYNETLSHGGVLREGAYVRVHHCDGAIIKIEIKK